MQNITKHINPKNLFVLPFDHRAGFAQKMLGYGEVLSLEEKDIVTSYKKIIYDAIFKAIEMGVPKEYSAVLVDEVYGLEIIKDAKEKGLVTMQTTEKSGLEHFEFEYGTDEDQNVSGENSDKKVENYKTHLLNIMPTYAKALVRYDISEDNTKQLGNLKNLSDFVKENNIGLLIEPLIKVRGEQSDFDHNFRYIDLMQMITEMQDYGIEADVWKIEGLYEKFQYEEVVKAARNTESRAGVGIIILGRNETKEHVMEWIKAGHDVEGVLGFAVGRTIFWNPLMEYKEGKINRDEAVNKIATEYFEYYKVFTNNI